MEKIVLPPCGILLGNAIYNTSGFLPSGTGWYYTSWSAQRMTPEELVLRTVRENQGNLVQFWWNGSSNPRRQAAWLGMDHGPDGGYPEPDWENMRNFSLEEFPELLDPEKEMAGRGVLRSLKLCQSLGLYSCMIYLHGVNPEYSKDFTKIPGYVGYDFGERFTFRYEGGNSQTGHPRLDLLAEDFTRRVKEHVKECRDKGYGRIMCTSSNIYMDYEVAAGVDLTLFEDCTCELNFASALSRGLCRLYGLDIWGSHIANEHYSWLDKSNPHRFKTLRCEMAMKYLAGAKIIISESGAWHCQATGSPQDETPRILQPILDPMPPMEKLREGALKALKHRKDLDEDSEWCRNYRAEMSAFYDYVKKNGTPKGQPETSMAIVKGKYDLCTLDHRSRPNRHQVIAGLHSWAESHMEWFEGAPEDGWGIAADTFWPTPQGIYGSNACNRILSGTPYGQVDILSFAGKIPSAQFLLENYKTIAFLGWNTMTPEQYGVLAEYVEGGGRLFISIPHLSTDVTRSYASYTKEDLINSGDFSSLCSIKVKGRGPRFYWVAPKGRENDLFLTDGSVRMFGAFRGQLGDIEILSPDAKVLYFDHESTAPVLVKIPKGKGEVWFLNSWFYPGTFNTEYAPGSTPGDTGFIGAILGHFAKQSRGYAYIAECGGDEPRKECSFINFSYFPESDEALLFNIDFERPHTVDLYLGGRKRQIEIGAQEIVRIKDCRRLED